MSEENKPKPGQEKNIPQERSRSEDLSYDRGRFDKSEQPTSQPHGGLNEGYTPTVDISSPPPGQGDDD